MTSGNAHKEKRDKDAGAKYCKRLTGGHRPTRQGTKPQPAAVSREIRTGVWGGWARVQWARKQGDWLPMQWWTYRGRRMWGLWVMWEEADRPAAGHEAVP